VEVCWLLFGLSAYANAQDGTFQMLLEAEVNKTRREGQVRFW